MRYFRLPKEPRRFFFSRLHARVIRTTFNKFSFLFFNSCSACDTLFPSLMLLEHHKEEYEHWDETEEFHGPCCRHNRRDDFDFSDSETCTSDAESEDLERLL